MLTLSVPVGWIARRSIAYVDPDENVASLGCPGPVEPPSERVKYANEDALQVHVSDSRQHTYEAVRYGFETRR